MPHKRNPVDATLALASARLAAARPGASSPRPAAGARARRWRLASRMDRRTQPVPFHGRRCVPRGGGSGGAAGQQRRMKANLEQGGDLLMAEALAMALAPRLGRPEAQRLVRAACNRAVEKGQTLCQAALEDGQLRAALSPERIRQALDPFHYLGSTDTLIDRALASYRALVGER